MFSLPHRAGAWCFFLILLLPAPSSSLGAAEGMALFEGIIWTIDKLTSQQASAERLQLDQPDAQIKQCEMSSTGDFHVGEKAQLSVVALISYGTADGNGSGILKIFQNGIAVKKLGFRQGRRSFEKRNFTASVIASWPGHSHFHCEIEVVGLRKSPLFDLKDSAKDSSAERAFTIEEPYQIYLAGPKPSAQVQHGETVHVALMLRVLTQANGVIVPETTLLNGRPPQITRIPGNERSGDKSKVWALSVARRSANTLCKFQPGEIPINFESSGAHIELWRDGVKMDYEFRKDPFEILSLSARSLPVEPPCHRDRFDLTRCRCLPPWDEIAEVPSTSKILTPPVWRIAPLPVVPNPGPQLLPSPRERYQTLSQVELAQTLIPRYIVKGQSFFLKGGDFDCTRPFPSLQLGPARLSALDCSADQISAKVPEFLPVGELTILWDDRFLGTTTALEISAGGDRAGSKDRQIALWIRLRGSLEPFNLDVSIANPESCSFGTNVRSLQIQTSGGELNESRFFCHSSAVGMPIQLNIGLSGFPDKLVTAE